MRKVLIGGLKHESNSFSTLKSSIEDFNVIYDLSRDPVTAYLMRSGFKVIPAFIADAPPSGLVDRGAYEELRDRLVGCIESAGELDGIFLDLHGAMEVEGVGSGELNLVKSIRNVVGYDTVVSASFDLHGNIPEELVEELDVLVAYRSAPHVDVEETRLRAASLLVACIEKKLKTSCAIIKPPMLLPGEYFVTSSKPASLIMDALPQIDAKTGVLASSVLVGCAWTDAPYSTPSTIVVAESGFYDTAVKEAKILALELWRRRGEFKPDVDYGEPEDVLERAVRCKRRPVVISDSGDNVTAGGGGDVPVMLELLLENRVKESLVAGFYDPDSVRTCKEVGEGAEVKLSLGGKVDRVNGYVLDVKARVLTVAREEVLVRIEEGVDVIVSSRRKVYTRLEDYMQVGVDPRSYRIVVVKMGYLFPEIRRLAARAYMALTPGFTCLKIRELPYRRVRRPVYPLDGEFEWSP